MTNAVRSETQQLKLAMVDYDQVVKTPLRLLPPPLQPPALRLWACHRHLAGMESALSLAGMLSVWISEFGLSVDDAQTVLVGMLDPRKMQHFRFASDLTSSLAAEASRVIEQRKKEAKAERDRKIAEDAKRNAVPLDGLKDELRKRGSIVATVPFDHEAAARNADFVRRYGT